MEQNTLPVTESCCSQATASAPEQTTDAEPEKRKGFHPVLVVTTVVTVVFVLWFCPWIFIKARIPATEAAAAVALMTAPDLLALSPEELKRKHDGSLLASDLQNAARVAGNFQISTLRHAKTGARVLCLVPKYYAETANRSFCLLEGKVYTADLGPKPEAKQFAEPEAGMRLIK